MKIFRKGFTLAEVLLVLGIIGIVSAMGMVITKKATDKAYDYYVYNGYINLLSTLYEAEMNNDFTNNVSGLSKYINNILGVDPEPLSQTYSSESSIVLPNIANFSPICIIRAKNGVQYYCYQEQNSVYSNIRFSMFVPAPKTRTNESGLIQTDFVYHRRGITSGWDADALIPIAYDGHLNLQDRKDLLPVYIDDGLSGRVRYDASNSSGNVSYTNRRYYSYREAYCRNTLQDLQINGYSDPVISCTGITLPASNDIGVLKFADPRYAK